MSYKMLCCTTILFGTDMSLFCAGPFLTYILEGPKPPPPSPYIASPPP